MSTDGTVRWGGASEEFWNGASDNSVVLDIVTSCKTQTEKAFEELVNTINSHPVRQKIKRVNVTDASYLYRHFIPEFSVDGSVPTKRFPENEVCLAKLEVEHTFTHWKDGLSDPRINDWIRKLTVDFAGDEKGNGILPEFRQTVLSEAEKYVMEGDGGFSNCIRFILEECAYICLHFQNSVVAYPISLSAPVEFAIKHYNTNITLLTYSTSDIETARQTEEERKAAEQSEFLSELHQISVRSQDEFIKFISDVAHDIVSPLVSLEFFSKNCKNLLPNQQNQLSGIAASIRGVVNDLLQNYKKMKERADLSKGERILASLAVSEVIEQKKLQYQDDVEINFSCDSAARFAFVNVDYSNFARMVSDLIDNSINSCEGLKGRIDISFYVTDKSAVFGIKDNGRGVSSETAEKISKRISVVSEDNQLLRMTQVFNTLDLYRGQLSVCSENGRGSEFRITLPTEIDYLSAKIILPKDGTIVVMDWDGSVYPVLKKMLTDYIDVRNMKVFRCTSEMVDFFNRVSEEEKNKVFVCMSCNDNKIAEALGVLIRSNLLKQCLAITSSYNSFYFREILARIDVKIFPRQFLEYAEIVLE